MNRGDASGEFERWLDRELRATLGAELGTPPPRPLHRRPGHPLGRRRVAGLGVGGAAAVFAVVLAVAGGSAALATGSPNPVSWGQQVVQAVSACADQSGGDAQSGVRPDVGRCLGTPARPVPTPDAAPAPPPATSRAPVTPQPQAAGTPAGESQDASDGRPKQSDRGAADPPPGQDRAPKAHGHTPAASAGKNPDH